jgi:transcriptional regulator of acetoin/glycerol metabolism
MSSIRGGTAWPQPMLLPADVPPMTRELSPVLDEPMDFESDLESSRSDSDHTMELEWPQAKGPWLLELGSASGTTTRVLELGERLVLGGSAHADVRLRDRTVSARHASVRASSEGVRVEDLGSKNGVFVGAARVDSVLLPGSGSSFVLGRTTVSVRPHSPADDVGEVETLPGVVGTAAVMRRLAREVRRHARHRVALLLHGESGTGKDLVARAAHLLSGRPGQWVPVNVGAINESLADTELFGHRRGAFTGAVVTRAGAFEQADRGTLFLDEIAELAPALQVKLLRVVEDGVVRPIGAMQPIRVDVRIVAATWAELGERVAIGRFREDLFHRLARVVIELPPLRQRRSDIPALARALLGRMQSEIGPKRLTSAALARLVAHAWPGNVRELESVLYRAGAATDGGTITPQQIELSLPRVQRAPASPLRPHEVLDLFELHEGKITTAARAAGVARSTFRCWLEKAKQSAR